MRPRVRPLWGFVRKQSFANEGARKARPHKPIPPMKPNAKNTLLPRVLALLVFAVAAIPFARAESVKVGDPLPPWSEGCLDIHHINTGRGESSFIIMPDGTTMLVDAGAVAEKPRWSPEARPDASRAPGEWIARYIARAMRATPKKTVSYAMLSHFHIDHMGALSKNTPDSRTGPYKASGITEVADFVPFEKIIDRAWPDYKGRGGPWNDAKMKNYRKFVDWQIANKGMKAERFKVGVNNQITLVNNPANYPNFEIRNLSNDGIVWTGTGAETRDALGEHTTSGNKCSIAFRLAYGKFKYFSGGDLDCRGVETGGVNIEAEVARASGRVDVIKANHHGNYDANGPDFMRALSPRVVIIDTLGASQPSMNVWRRLRDKALFPERPDVFATNLMEATALAMNEKPEKVSIHSHVVVRVSPGGEKYFVYRVTDTDESGRVQSVHGPYHSR
ncbi:beta-lactamase superfamily II metal-dependent hydrolase [Ereboglobus sp. PH5-5]|nr:beta-lactamase superfamily II metal-dependent hydrolase [Ereboglobus sp. PH5-5]